MSYVDVRFPLSMLGPQTDFFLSHLITVLHLGQKPHAVPLLTFHLISPSH